MWVRTALRDATVGRAMHNDLTATLKALIAVAGPASTETKQAQSLLDDIDMVNDMLNDANDKATLAALFSNGHQNENIAVAGRNMGLVLSGNKSMRDLIPQSRHVTFASHVIEHTIPSATTTTSDDENTHNREKVMAFVVHWWKEMGMYFLPKEVNHNTNDV